MAGGFSGVALAYYTLPLVALVLHVGLGYWIYRSHWNRPGAKWFVFMLGAGAVEVFLYWIMLLSPPSPFSRALFYPIAMLAFVTYVAWAVFAGRYTGTDFHQHWLIRATFVAILGGFTALTILRPVENLLILNLRTVTEPIVYYSYDIGPGLGVIYLLVYALSFYTTYRLIVYLLSTSARSTKQLALLVAGSLSVVLITSASQAGLFPAAELNHAPYATILFIVLATLALFRFDLLNVQPVARNAVVENLRDPVVVLDDDDRVVDYNDARTRLWPDIDEKVGESFETACPTLAAAIDLSESDDGTRLTLPGDGSDRHYSVTVSRVGHRDEDREWLSILLRDVTALERSRWQLERQNERLDQVASTVSHDLRNPINVADGYTEILDDMIAPDGLDAEEADTADQHLDQIRTSHDRMEAIIADVLTIAREGKTVEETRSVSLATAARDAWANVDTGDATLTVDGDCQLQADRSKFLSILENLFRNALDHGLDDVTVEVDVIGGGFAVADDGPGIPDEHADDIFEYGYTTTDEGTGLGLSIVKTMAESHGWTVEYDTDTQQGARFVFGNVDVDHDAGRPEVGPGQS